MHKPLEVQIKSFNWCSHRDEEKGVVSVTNFGIAVGTKHQTLRWTGYDGRRPRPSICFPYCWVYTRSPGARSLFQRTRGVRMRTPWTGCQHYGRYGNANQTVVSLGWRRKPGVPRGNSRRTGRTCKLQQRLDWNPQTRRSEANVCKKSQSGQKFTFQYCRDFKHDKNMRPIFGLVPIFFSPRVRPLHLIRFVNQKIIKIIRIQHSNLHSKVSLSREPCVWAADEGLQRPDG